MNKQEALKALQDDTNYYGDFGKKYLSNSDIGTLLTNPLALGQKQLTVYCRRKLTKKLN